MRQLLFAVLAFGVVGCSDGESKPLEPETANPSFSALIDGTAWESQEGKLSGTAGSFGTFQVVAFDSSRAVPIGLTLSLYNIDKPGIYPLGVGPSVVGGSIDLKIGNTLYHQLPTGNGGTIIITQVSATRLAGTFFMSFATPYDFGPPSPTVNITEANFDVPITASGPIAVQDKGGNMIGTVGLKAWRAANIDAAYHANGSLTIEGSNFDYVVAAQIPNFPGPGTYQLRTDGHGGISVRSQRDDWAVTDTRGSGTITITRFSTSRLAGSINAIALPGPGSLQAGPIAVVLAFDTELIDRP